MRGTTHPDGRPATAGSSEADADGEPVTVVLVHWNQPDACAASIAAFREQGVPVTVLVVDNASRPADRQRLQQVVAEAGDGVDVLALDGNRGFGPGANAGLRAFLAQGRGAWVAVAPHDALPRPAVLRRLIDVAETHERTSGARVGLVCADVGDDQTPVVDPYFGGMTMPARVSDGWEDADYPHGTLLLARRACLEDIGLFDERYFAYCEEADLGIRAREAGWQVGLVRGARVVNPTMRSGSAVTDYLMQRNTLLLVREHSGRYHATIRLLIAVIHLVRGIVQPSSRAWIFSVRGRLWAIADFLRGRYGPPPASLYPPAAT